MTVNHDVTGSSPVRGAKKKRPPSCGLFFLLLGKAPPCDIMIYIHLHTDWARALRGEVGSWRRKKRLNGCFFKSKAKNKEFRKWAGERAKRLCFCRVALAMVAQAGESETLGDVTGWGLVRGSHPHRSKMQPMPKILVLQGFFGFLGQFFWPFFFCNLFRTLWTWTRDIL